MDNLSKKKQRLLTVFILLLLALLPLSQYAIKNKIIFNNNAQENVEQYVPVEIPTEPEYVKGEIIIKLKEPLAEDIDDGITSSQVLGESTESTDSNLLNVSTELLPTVINELKTEYQAETVEKAYEDVSKSTPQSEVEATTESIQPDKVDSIEEEVVESTLKVTFDDNVSIVEVAEELSLNPEIEYAEPNYIYRIDAAPNDPYYTDSYPNEVGNRDAKWNPPHDYQWNIKKTNSSENWNTDVSGIVVAVIDTGVDINHSELGNFWKNTKEIGNDSIDNDQNGCIDDIYGCNSIYNTGNIVDDNNHGTHVAGVISSRTNNSDGIAGITSNAKIMAVKAMNSNGTGDTLSIIKGIRYAVDNGAHVINMSLGGNESLAYKDAIDYAVASNVIIVASAGNGNNHSNKQYPASHPNVITVAAVDENLNKLNYSNYGSVVDVAAPGGGSTCFYNSKPGHCSNILSLLSSQSNQDADLTVGGKYLRLSGTSMAAPHVAGVAALLLAKNPAWLQDSQHKSLDYFQNYLRFNSLGSRAGQHTEQFGWGVINSTGTTFIPPTNIQFEVLFPAEKAIVGSEFVVSGKVSADDFDFYTIEYKHVQDSQWLKQGVTLVNDGKTIRLPVTSSQLSGKAAEFGKVSLPINAKKGIYEIKTTLFLKSGQKLISIKKIEFKQKNNTTWRNIHGAIPSFGTNLTSRLGQVLIEDLDGDSKKEIIATEYRLESQSGDNYLAVYDSNYNLKWEVLAKGEVVIGEFDKTRAGKEIALQTNKSITNQHEENIFVYDKDGNKIDSFTKTFSYKGGFQPNILAADANNNGIDELYSYQTSIQEKGLKAYEQNSTGLFENIWSFNHDSVVFSLSWPVSGDFDGNGDLEILLMGQTSFTIIDGNGSFITSGSYFGNKIAIVDLNKDKKDEIILTTQTDLKVLQLNNNQIIQLWSKPHPVASSVRIADFNNDSYPDVYTYTKGTRTSRVFNNNGDLLFEGFSPVYSSNDYLFDEISIADFDNDTNMEIYATGHFNTDSRGYLSVQEFNHSTKEIQNVDGEWKILNPYEGVSVSLALSDLDNNGKLDMILGGYGIIEYDNTASKIAWLHRHANSKRNNNYLMTQLIVPTPTVTNTPTPTNTPIPSFTPLPTKTPTPTNTPTPTPRLESVSGYVWYDTNNNGKADLNEEQVKQPLEIAFIQSNNITLKTILSAPNWKFLFRSNSYGSTKIWITLPQGYQVGNRVGDNKYSQIVLGGKPTAQAIFELRNPGGGPAGIYEFPLGIIPIPTNTPKPTSTKTPTPSPTRTPTPTVTKTPTPTVTKIPIPTNTPTKIPTPTIRIPTPTVVKAILTIKPTGSNLPEARRWRPYLTLIQITSSNRGRVTAKGVGAPSGLRINCLNSFNGSNCFVLGAAGTTGTFTITIEANSTGADAIKKSYSLRVK